MDGGYCFHPFLFVCLFVCLFVTSIPENLLDGFRRNLVGGGVSYGPRIMPLNFGLGPKSNMAAMAAILKKYLNFFFAFLHVLSDFQPPPPKKNVGEKNYNCQHC